MTFPKLLLNTMIRNIKIQNIFNLIIVSNSIKHRFNIFKKKLMAKKKKKKKKSYIFSKFDGSNKILCDIPSGSTQLYFHLDEFSVEIIQRF